MKIKLFHKKHSPTVCVNSRQNDGESCSDFRFTNVILGKNGFPLYEKKPECRVELKKQLPELYQDKSQCCACTACAMICPTEAIEMTGDEEGFLYPVVNALKCVRCYHCLNICPLKQIEQNN